MVRALTSHQCGPGSIPGPDAISGLSLCWFSSLLRGFFSGFSGFPPSAKSNIQLIPAGCKLCSKVTHGLYSGCQRRQCMLSVRPCRATSLLYFATAISRDNYYYYYYFTGSLHFTQATHFSHTGTFYSAGTFLLHYSYPTVTLLTVTGRLKLHSFILFLHRFILFYNRSKIHYFQVTTFGVSVISMGHSFQIFFKKRSHLYSIPRSLPLSRGWVPNFETSWYF